MQEDIRTALKSISSHKMRSFLTILGVIIGIASIIAIVSAIKGTNQAVMEKMIGAGNNNVTVRLSQGGEPVSLDYERPEGVRPVTAGQKDEIRALNGAVDATFYYHREFAGPVSSGEHLLDAAGIHGIDSHYLNTRSSFPFSPRFRTYFLPLSLRTNAFITRSPESCSGLSLNNSIPTLSFSSNCTSSPEILAVN